MDNTTNPEAAFDYFAKLYQEKYMDISLYHESLNWFCEAIEMEKPRILELGCGPGNITHYLLEKRPDFRILATDISNNMLSLAIANNPSAETRKLDIKNTNTLEEKFNGIVCGFCLPYLSHAETSHWISSLQAMLNPHGILYISTMEGGEEKSGYKKSSSGEGPELFINYYTEDFLVDLLKENDFGILQTELIYYSNDAGETVSDLVILAGKLS